VGLYMCIVKIYAPAEQKKRKQGRSREQAGEKMRRIRGSIRDRWVVRLKE